MADRKSDNWRKLEKIGDVQIAGDVAVEIEFHDGTPHALTLRGSEGGAVRAMAAPYQGIQVLVPAPPAIVRRWRVSGKLPGGIEVVETYDTMDAARNRTLQLREDQGAADLIDYAEIEVPEGE